VTKKKHSVVTFEGQLDHGRFIAHGHTDSLSTVLSQVKRPGRHPSALTEPFDLGSAQIETICPSLLRFQLLEPVSPHSFKINFMSERHICRLVDQRVHDHCVSVAVLVLQVEAETATSTIRGDLVMVSASIRARSLILAGLPMPECNLIIGDDQRPMGRVDLVYLAYKLIIEYEGDQHRTDRGQWNRDIDRQKDFARDHWMLIRVTSERARWPRQVVRAVYKALKVNGYDGPEPQFNELWMSLFD
jgi:hypothetical protein